MTYEPGTVAVATVRGVPNVRVMRSDHFGGAWTTGTMIGGSYLHSHSVTDVRPLVVLDPDAGAGLDAKPDVRLAASALRVLMEQFGQALTPESRSAIRWLRAALEDAEEQTRPPRPAEPQGLGAVVKDREGEEWVRCRRAGARGLQGVEWENARTTRHTYYADIDAVAVLSPGVSS